MTYTYRNARESLIDLSNKVMYEGNVVPSRIEDTKEIFGMNIEISSPRQRCMLVPFRHDNIFAKIAESLWVLAGRNDLKFLGYYLPRAWEFSDDNGETWRAAYGMRLRHAGVAWDSSGAWNFHGVDQLREMLDILKVDKGSRRAVATIFDPELDYEVSNDIPCNNWMQFLIRENRLHMFMTQRSSDLMWGYSGINTFEWSILHEAMSYWIGVPMGSLFYSITSLHLYKKHWKRAVDIARTPPSLPYTLYNSDYWNLAPSFITPFSTLAYKLDMIFDIQNKAQNLPLDSINTDLTAQAKIELDPFLYECLMMLLIYISSKDEFRLEITWPLLQELTDSDFHLCALEYLCRKNFKSLLSYPFLSNKYSTFLASFMDRDGGGMNNVCGQANE